MSSESYRLPWVQSTSDFANSQDVRAIVNGTPSLLAEGAMMNIASISYDFITDANVEWWVVTKHQNGIDSVDSVHVQFVAKNKAPLVAAVPGEAIWERHTP